MNLFARISARNAELDAAYQEWLRQQGSRLAWPKADYMAVLVAGATLFGIFTLYSVPDSETTIWLRSQIAFWMNAALFALAIMNAAAFALWNGGKGITIRFEEAPVASLDGGEPLPQIAGKSPFLTPFERQAIEGYKHQRLSLETAAKVKACIRAGMTTHEAAAEIVIGEPLVRRYANLLQCATVDLDLTPLSE